MVRAKAKRSFVSWAATLLTFTALLSPARSVFAGNIIWSQAASLVLPGSGITLTIDASSQADSLTVNPSSFTVVVAAAETFTVRYPGPSYGTMSNNGSIDDCNIVGSDNVSVVSGPKTVTFTPSTSTCTPSGGGGGSPGGGGGTAAPSIRLYAPNGGETISGGSTYNVFWTYTGSQARGVSFSLSMNAGPFDILVANANHSSGYYPLPMPTPAADATAKLRIRLLGDGGAELAVDDSDASFTIDVPDTSATTTPPLPEEPPSVPGPLPEPYSPNATIAGDKGLANIGTPLALFCKARELIKLPDDGNASTQYDSAVYYCGPDGKRYVFPNAKVYKTWYPDFSKVRIISAAEMAALPLGGNVTYRPAARLIKIQSDPKTYAVEHDGRLRHVPDEATAIALYGSAWRTLVDDIDVSFFLNYRIGPPLASVAP